MSPRQLSTNFCAGLLKILLFYCLLHSRTGAEVPSHFEQANRLYEKGSFSEAASLYESMIKSGRQSASIYFNLGNAYFKKTELGRALFNYRRAERLAPRDPDIQANLRFTRERVDGGLSLSPSVWRRALHYFTLNEISTVCALLFWAWAALVCLVQFRPKLQTKLRGVGLIMGSLLACALLLLVISYISSRERIAIVANSQAKVHLGPLPESQTAFTAADGSELKVLAERKDWIQVSDRSNRSGWVASTNVLIFQ